MLVRTVLVVFALALSVSAIPARDYYGGIFDNPFFKSPAFDDEVSAEESVSSPDYAELPHHPVGSFSSLGSMLDGIFHRMRQQFERFPTPSFQIPKFPTNFGFQPAGFGLPNQPGNSSSTSTVVGDHVVTVNETVYHKDDGGVKSVFRIKVIDVSPNQESSAKQPAEKNPSSSSTTEGSIEEIVEVDLPAELEKAEPTAVQPEEASTESVEDVDNEIPKQTRETLMETLKRWKEQERARSAPESPDDEVELIVPANETPIDLSSDLRVNLILQDQARKGGLFLADPEAEFVEVDDQGKLLSDLQQV